MVKYTFDIKFCLASVSLPLVCIVPARSNISVLLIQLASRLVAMWPHECGYKMPAAFHCSSAGWKVYDSAVNVRSDTANMCFVCLELMLSPIKWYAWAHLNFVNHTFHCSYGGGPPRFGGNRGGGGGGKFGNPGDRLRKKQWNLDELPKFEKNFYQQHPDVARRSMVCCQHGP